MQRDHDSTCPVCFEHNDDMAPLDPCRHRMCPPCFHRWRAAKLPEAPTCPVCRATVAGLLDTAIEDRVDLQLSRFRKWRDDAGLVDQPHQEHGVRWALRHEARSDGVCGARSGGLICDEMGLGKTIIAVALIVSNFRTRTLILLPPSLIPQWVDVFKRICHHVPLVFHGRAKRYIDADTLAKAPIVIASYYTTAAAKKQLLTPLHHLHWGRLIMDEAHHVRSRKTLYNGVMALQTDLTWMLTGTPLQNSETDLTAYWHILGVSQDITRTMYAQDRHRLRDIIASRILRRTKDSIDMDIPPVVHETVIVPWDDHDELHFAAELHSQLSFSGLHLDKVSPCARFLTRNSLAALVRCRQACILPSAIDTHIRFHAEATRSGPSAAPSATSKLRAVLAHILASTHTGRKLVFCHYTLEIDFLLAHARAAGLSAHAIDGRTHPSHRHSLIALAPDILILQIRTASEGLNLQAFSHVYFVSPHWNPALERQAIARAHRFGQTRTVHATRFIMDHILTHHTSLDAHAAHSQTLKLALAHSLNL
jgi:SNF2 family DNA or RNA helicase